MKLNNKNQTDCIVCIIKYNNYLIITFPYFSEEIIQYLITIVNVGNQNVLKVRIFWK